MPNYTLYYFNGRGRADLLRMMLAAADVKYTDKTFEFNEWDKYRNDMPCNRVPCLELDGGIKMPETMAIARYLAREYKLYPTNNIDIMRCDYIADCFYEIMHDYMRYFHAKNGRFMFGENGEMISSTGGVDSDSYVNYMQWRYMNTFNRVMPFMERTLSMQDGENKFFIGNDLTWCDMVYYSCLENPYLENPSIFNPYPKLMALQKRICEHPKISPYLMSRAKTDW